MRCVFRRWCSEHRLALSGKHAAGAEDPCIGRGSIVVLLRAVGNSARVDATADSHDGPAAVSQGGPVGLMLEHGVPEERLENELALVRLTMPLGPGLPML